MSKLLIIDYGMGNLRSVQKAVERVGFQADVSDDPDAVRNADKIILPGVGAFEDAMNALRQCELIEPIKEAVSANKPFFGICLGLQMLFETSYEDGEHAGLGILAGTVEKFNPHPAGGEHLKVPHMGWNRVHVRRRAPVLEGVPDSFHMYFVHSYYVKPTDDEVTATETDYGGPFTSMVWKGNLFATQFHPEKSQRYGLQMLENFCRM